MQVKTHIDWHAVVQPLPDHRLPLDVDVLPVFDGQSLDEFAVQVQRHGLGLHAEADLVPAAVKQVVNFGVLEHSSDSILRQADSVVLHRLVLAVQADGHLTGQREGNINDRSSRSSRGVHVKMWGNTEIRKSCFLWRQIMKVKKNQANLVQV